ncbi:transcriptional regulator [Labrys miyagiensis]|uniref:Transcriptional regulator n=1 Tax=Labrys miyagiensis TaxID=346912 RepID=A0ABQ6CZ88_9HYPH|nr:LysR family transcriptional regulator [Labrys miyagiensis]GLS23556.1 transcriptional regulator [Labrys miyagiensis]
MDWDKLKVFHAAAEAGSFTHAGDVLGLSQSAVSRQVSALEGDLRTPLFHRHARGLILTEQGEMLFRTTQDVMLKLESAMGALTDSRERPNGELRLTTTVGLGTYWLTPRIGEFLDLYPDIRLKMLLTEQELDLGMREADVALRLRQPEQGDLIQRRLFTVHFHIYAAPEYIKRFGQPRSIEEIDRHRIITFGGTAGSFIQEINWLNTAGRDPKDPREPVFEINNLGGVKTAVEKGVGLAVLPDYLVGRDSQLVQILTDAEMPQLETYFVYPEEMKNLARIQVFRDFLVSKAQRWAF